MPRTTRLDLSLEPSDTGKPHHIFNELVNWIEGGYLEFFKPRTTVNAATYSTVTTDYFLHVTYTSTGVVAITIDSDLVSDGRVLRIKDAGGNAGTYNITIDTEGAEPIDGESEQIIAGDWDSISMYCDGTDWFIF